MSKESIFKRVYDFYSKDLTAAEFERLIMQETPSRYKYFVRSIDKTSVHKNKVREILTFSRNFIVAFLTKLSPVIRIIYTVSVVAFIFSFLNGSWDMALLSFTVINLLLFFEIADKLTARDELEIAKDVQMSLIPGKPPEDKNFGISSYYETAKEVGGDFIDFVQKPDGSYIVAIGDISGKGMSAALHMLQVSLMFRYISDTLNNPKTILTFLNKNIFAYIKKGLYLSMTIAEVKEKSLKVCRAGHMPLLYYKSEGKTVTEIKQSGMALGLNNSDLFSGSLQEYQLNADKNDILVFYSDGLTESMNTQNAEFGLERLKRIISDNPEKSAEEIKSVLLNEIYSFRGFAEVHDDITFIIMKAL